jgi:NAD+ synthetase
VHVADIKQQLLGQRQAEAADDRAYYFANSLNYLVVGTGNRCELALGYYTKYGDGGVDLLPIGGLLKSEVRKMAAALGVPKPIIDKPPTAGLWIGQTDEAEMGFGYEVLERYLTDGPGAVPRPRAPHRRTAARPSASACCRRRHRHGQGSRSWSGVEWALALAGVP